jgi:hypothetical protein
LCEHDPGAVPNVEGLRFAAVGMQEDLAVGQDAIDVEQQQADPPGTLADVGCHAR